MGSLVRCTLVRPDLLEAQRRILMNVVGCAYAYVKLKEQEVRNLVWICECIVQNQRDAINNFIPIFSDNAPWRSKKGR